MFLDSFTPVIVAGIVGLAIAVFTIEIVWRIFRIQKPNPAKYEIYECGEIAVGDPKFANMGINYYIYALMFLIFDIEAVFLFPWAVNFYSLGFIGFIEVSIFVLLLFVALVYALKKDMLRWL